MWRRHRVWPWALAAAALVVLVGVLLLARLVPGQLPSTAQGPPLQRAESPSAEVGVSTARGADGGAAGSVDSLLTVAVLNGHGAPAVDCEVQLRVPGQRREEWLEAGAASCEAVELAAVPVGDYLVSVEAPGLRRTERPVHLNPGPATLKFLLPDGVAVSGRVADASGRPVPGVSVEVSPTGGVSRTDEAGAFRISVPGPGLYHLEAHHSDWGGAVQAVTAPASDVVLQLQPHSVLALTVRAGGQPVAGAQALLWQSGNSGTRREYAADRTTDAEGEVRLQGLPPGSYTLGVLPPGALRPSRQEVVLQEGVTTVVTLALPASAPGSIEGQVVDEVGRPVAGALVRAQPLDVPPARSDAGGHFRLVGVPEGVDYQLVAIADGAMSAARNGRAGEAGLRLSVPRARLYHGRVLDEAHRPVSAFRIAGVQVEAPDGRFSVSVRPPHNTVSLAVEAPQLAMATVVRPAADEEVGDIVLHVAPLVHGIVRQTDRTSAAGAFVVCEGCRGEAAGERHLTAFADAEGRFRLAITGPYGVLVRLVAMKDDRLGWAEAGRVGEEAVLTLAPPSTVRGRVLRPNGQAAGGVAVVLSEPLLEPTLLVSGADGRFSGEVRPGLYQVTLVPDTSQPQRTWTVQVPLDGSLDLLSGDAR